MAQQQTDFLSRAREQAIFPHSRHGRL